MRSLSSRHTHFAAALAALALALPGAVALAGPAAAATAPTVTLSVLVLDDGAPMVGAIKARLASEGVQTQVLDLTSAARPAITSTFLASSATTGNFSAVVLPSEAPATVTTDELAALAGYEVAFGVREFDAYTWAHPEVGLSYAADPGYIGPADGMTATVSAAAKSNGFGYLNGTFTLDDVSPTVSESWVYLATPYAALPAGQSFTPFLTAPIPGAGVNGSLLGVYAHDGREQLVSTLASNAWQQHWMVISHGVVSWLTRGISTSLSRNYFSVHSDDIFLPDARWSVDGKCTIGDGCDPVLYPDTAPGATSRMTPADVSALMSWQSANGMKIDMVFNGGGSDDQVAETGSDALATSFQQNQNKFRWINHTYSHQYLGCIQNFTVIPWACALTSTGTIAWATRSTIQNEIINNLYFAQNHRLQLNSNELVTGEHSGLKTLPQMTTDNPNLAPSLNYTGVRWVASDASRETTSRLVGGARTVPRHPMNVYYNVSTKTEETSEYNWIYTSAADGGSGYCTDHPDITTCIAPLDLATGFDSSIVPVETRIALSHVLGNDAMPHYIHQSNLTEDRIAYPVLSSILGSYRSIYATNTPIVNPKMADAGQTILRQQSWAAAKASVQAQVTGTTLTVRNLGTTKVDVPVTVPEGTTITTTTTVWTWLGPVTTTTTSPWGSAYGGQRSSWVTLGAGQKLTLNLPAVAYQAGAVSMTTATLQVATTLTSSTSLKAASTTSSVQRKSTTKIVSGGPQATATLLTDSGAVVDASSSTAAPSSGGGTTASPTASDPAATNTSPAQ